DLADYLVQRGVPFRRAHEMVGRMVARAEQLGVRLSDLPAEEIERIAPLAVKGFGEVFDLDRAMRVRTAPGAPSPERIAERIAWWEQRLQGS
ncbi:MAG: hypothetical protein NZL93_05085, partial [Chthoniobacterales bacterium]|nr:hypothetical protein [Chthoniobacterales bacterium]